jgi:DnaJ-class molecular chaperone
MSVNGTSAPASGSRDMERASKEARRSGAARCSRDLCPTCKGRGCISLVINYQHTSANCDRCQGTGRVNVEVSHREEASDV